MTFLAQEHKVSGARHPTQRHRFNRGTAVGAVLVVPAAFDECKATRVEWPALVQRADAMATFNGIPPAEPRPAHGFIHVTIGLAALRNECFQGVLSGNSALHEFELPVFYAASRGRAAR